MGTTRSDFGTTPDGRRVGLYTLTSRSGGVAKISEFGATLTELHVPDRDGRPGNVVLGFDDLGGYVRPHPYFGSTIGRVANRVAGARFTLEGVEYRLPANDGRHTLHGGPAGFHVRVWTVDEPDPATSALTLRYVSRDGEEGFPGTLTVACTYRLSDANELRIEWAASVDAKATPVNLCNHAYFNLRGAGTRDVLDHVLEIAAGRYTPVDASLVPTGELALVAGTPFDFTRPKRIGTDLRDVIGPAIGYDHNYVLDVPGLERVGVRVTEPDSGRVLEVATTQPGVQLYTGNFLDGSLRGCGGTYGRWGGLCLETQHFPDSVHHAGFPSTILRPGATYRHTTVYRFGTV